MGFLTCKDTQTFIEQNRDDGTQLWVFHHLPKTAGTSLVTQVASHLQPNYNVHIPLDLLAHEETDHDEQMKLAFRRFWQANAVSSFRFMSGHLSRRQIEEVLTLSNARVITMVRDPLQRLVSEYRFLQTTVNPRHQYFIDRYPSFHAYIENPISQNSMATMIGGPAASAEKCREILKNDYVFCGLFEMYAVSTALMRSLLGIESATEIHENPTSDEVPNEVDEPETYRDKVLAFNAVDGELYRFVQEQFFSRRTDIDAFLRSR